MGQMSAVVLIMFLCLGVLYLFRDKDNKRSTRKVVGLFSIIFIAMGVSGCTSNISNGNEKVFSDKKVEAQQTSNNISKDKDIKIHFINVGQADAILIEQAKQFMLIDAGNNDDSRSIEDYLKNQGVKKLEYVIGTHPHEDHIGSLDTVINKFNIGKVFMPKVSHTTKTYKDVIMAIKSKNLKITAPKVGDTYKLGDAEFKILAPNGDKYEDMNDYSIVIKLDYGDNSFIFTGDAESVSENEILKNKFDVKADLLKVGHHGSHSSTSEEFLDSVDPTYAVISCETGNDYGHPHGDTMERLKKHGVEVYRTDESGTIICTSNGKDISFNVKPGSYEYPSNNKKITNKKNYNSSSNNKDIIQNNNIIIEKINKLDEYVIVTNNSNKDIDLKGWKIVSITGNQEFIFPTYNLKSGNSVKITSGKEKGDLKWGKTNIWNNGKSDPGKLYNSGGKLVFTYDD